MIRVLSLLCVFALATIADAAPRRASTSGGCTGDSCKFADALLHPVQTVSKVIHHPQKLPAGPVDEAPTAPVPSQSCPCTASVAATGRQGGRFHIFPIFHRNSGARGSGGGCGCGR